MLLAGDIGGTNVRLDFYNDDGCAPIDHPARGNEGDLRLPMTYRKCPIIDAVGRFAKDFASEVEGVDRACFGIAGKITNEPNGTAHVAMTNRPHEDVTNRQIGAALGANVWLVNDMAAHIASVGVAPCTLIHAGRNNPSGVRAILMPGTGCGVGFAIQHASGFRPSPSEGGHFEFPPRNAEQSKIVDGLRKLLPAERGTTRVTYESVLSGPGLENLYACLADPSSTRLVAGVDGQAITCAAAGQESVADPDLARRAVELFVEVLAQYASNLGLLLLPTAGLWLGGNIIDAIRSPDSQAFDDRFVRTYLDAGGRTQRGILEQVPIRLLDPVDTGLLGAAQIAAGM
ncbi:MAG: glucokinase [Planctomycetota bacterium]